MRRHKPVSKSNSPLKVDCSQAWTCQKRQRDRGTGRVSNLRRQEVTVDVTSCPSLLPLQQSGHDGAMSVQSRCQICHGDPWAHWLPLLSARATEARVGDDGMEVYFIYAASSRQARTGGASCPPHAPPYFVFEGFLLPPTRGRPSDSDCLYRSLCQGTGVVESGYIWSKPVWRDWCGPDTDP